MTSTVKDLRQFSVPSQNAQEAWHAALSQLSRYGQWVDGVEDSQSIGSRFGATTRSTCELIGHTLIIDSPRQRLIQSDHRPVDLGFAIANTLWVLAGTDDVEKISFYNPRGRQFSDEGTRLFAAPGRRIFASPKGDQFERVIERLSNDKNTRRAVIQIFSSADLFADTRDCSCFLSLQFLLREDRLSCLTFMRSQSALMVMPYDLFLCSMLQEAVASRIGVDLGPYYHICGSLHYYEDEEDLVEAVLQEPIQPVRRMEPMPSLTREVRDRLAETELAIRMRLSEEPGATIDVHGYGLGSYWSILFAVMVAATRRRLGIEPSNSVLADIPDPYRSLITFRR